MRFGRIGNAATILLSLACLRRDWEVYPLRTAFVKIVAIIARGIYCCQEPLRTGYNQFMSVQEIENAVSALPSSDLAEFMQWFEQFQAREQERRAEEDRQWDEQIARDVQTGRLDSLITRTKEQAAAGQCWTISPGAPLTPWPTQYAQQ